MWEFWWDTAVGETIGEKRSIDENGSDDLTAILDWKARDAMLSSSWSVSACIYLIYMGNHRSVPGLADNLSEAEWDKTILDQAIYEENGLYVPSPFPHRNIYQVVTWLLEKISLSGLESRNVKIKGMGQHVSYDSIPFKQLTSAAVDIKAAQSTARYISNVRSPSSGAMASASTWVNGVDLFFNGGMFVSKGSCGSWEIRSTSPRISCNG